METRRHGITKHGDMKNMETWKNGNMDSWRYGYMETYGGMDIQRHGNIMETSMETLKDGNMETRRFGDMETWGHRHGDMDMDTWARIPGHEDMNMEETWTWRH
jgi:hypothetical protein